MSAQILTLPKKKAASSMAAMDTIGRGLYVPTSDEINVLTGLGVLYLYCVCGDSMWCLGDDGKARCVNCNTPHPRVLWGFKHP